MNIIYSKKLNPVPVSFNETKQGYVYRNADYELGVSTLYLRTDRAFIDLARSVQVSTASTESLSWVEVDVDLVIKGDASNA